ncbi:hypothetical protein FB451DRAFT_1369764 [Mycena latifolia]|nr:hypothetical protein FB451DRAFT_1369764 [Mycena latifolia]
MGSGPPPSPLDELRKGFHPAGEELTHGMLDHVRSERDAAKTQLARRPRVRTIPGNHDALFLAHPDNLESSVIERAVKLGTQAPPQVYVHRSLPVATVCIEPETKTVACTGRALRGKGPVKGPVRTDVIST